MINITSIKTITCHRLVSKALIYLCFVSFAVELSYACPDIDGLVDINCDKQLVIACFGDSITSGVHDEQRLGGYPGRLESMFPNSVILNLGVPGEQTVFGKMRASSIFSSAHYIDYTVVLEGVNDATAPTASVNSTSRNLLSIVASASSHGAVVMLGSLLPSYRGNQYSWVRSVNAQIRPWATIDFFALGSSILSADRLHPDASGYQKMADLIANTMYADVDKDRPVDTDGDGVYDFEEQSLGTSAQDSDSDKDGLTDAEELYSYNTNPLAIDTDNDGLSDEEEVKVLHTNPTDSRPSAPEIISVSVLNAD